MNASAESVERELSVSADPTTLAMVTKAELDQQITTARAYPRSLKRFVNSCREMATLNQEVAAECFYSLPRDGKMIEGPSARLAEIVASAWGNCRAGSRVVDEGNEFITAQGVFHDLEQNVAITYEVKRRITNKFGKRYSADMIAVTGNAACSIALRNAVFKGVPKAFWNDIYKAARLAAVGDIKTLANTRAEAFAYLQKMRVPKANVLQVLGVDGEEDVGIEEIASLRGLINSIKEGETTVDEVFFKQNSGAGKVPDLPKPDKYDNWAADLEAVAENGSASLEASYMKSQPALREYLNRIEPERWERIKGKAKACDVDKQGIKQ
jgi:hypothetical protein